MARLIDLDELMKFPIRIDHYDKEHGNEHFVYGVETVLEYAENLPTVDAVEVVRCKDCGNSEPCNPPRGRVWCRKLCRYMNEDGYCSESERKTNGVQS